MLTPGVLSRLVGLLPAALLMAQVSLAQEAQQPQQEPPPTAAEVVYEAYEAKGIDAAVAKFRELLADESGEHAFLEREFIWIGVSRMVGRGKRDEAIKFLPLVVEKFPESSMGWSSLGSTHLGFGDKEKPSNASPRPPRSTWSST